MKLFVPLLDNGNGDVKANFLMCFYEAFRDRDVFIMRSSDSHPDRGMNKIANAFLRSDCDVWINIDADIIFTREHIDKLISHNLPLVYGLYPKKSDDAPPCVCTFAEIEPPTANHLVKMRRCGRGFMLVKRELLEAMKEDNGGPALRYHNHGHVEWDFFPSGTVSGRHSALSGVDSDGFPKREWLSEDWYFCERARDLGVYSYVDSSIVLAHEGAKVYSFRPEQTEPIYDPNFDWHDIHGWFSDEDANAYKTIVDALPENGGVIIELGSWQGRSTACLVKLLRDAGKEADIHCVDTFRGTENEGEVHAKHVREHGGSVRKVFVDNMKKIGAENIHIHEGTTLGKCLEFPAKFADAIFIDADHEYRAVQSDILAYFPILKPGGIMAGHDYDYPGVKKAVDNRFGSENVQRIGRCWLVRS